MTDIILGPPGTGKTTSLIERVEDALDRGVPPDRIGYFSFTRKAAHEAIERACAKFKLTREDFPHFSTLHSMCYRQLGMKRADVLEGKRMHEFAKYAGVRITGKWSEDGTLTGFDLGDRMIFMENLARIRGVPLRKSYDEDDDGIPWDQMHHFASALTEFKRAYKVMDFTDMLAEFVRSGISLGLEELMIDESQDLSPLQWRVVGQLADGCKKVSVAGDDDQAIYRWAGADVDHLIDMRGNVTVLGQSYRVPPVIQTVALDVIRGVHHRREKKWAARTGGEGAVDYERRFEYVNVDDGQVLVLARNTYVLQEQVIPVLHQMGVVYEYRGHSSIKKGLLEVIQNWENLRKRKRITVAQAREIYGYMTSGLGVAKGHKTLPDRNDDDMIGMKELREEGGLLRDDPWYDALNRIETNDMDYLRSARARGEKLAAKPRVLLSTIHGAKGGQADHVVVMKEIAVRTWRELQTGGQRGEEDERRVWYVGCTRAKERLTIVDAETPRACPWI